MHRRTIRNGFAAVLLLAGSLGAQAQLFRAYLSQAGNDANPCTLQQPCRLLPKALSAIHAGGEIWMLDSANYNTATVDIDKSVSILAVPGAVGSVVATGGPAIRVSAPDHRIALRNILIAPLPGTVSTNGIELLAYSALIIEDSVIASLAGTCVYATGSGRIRIDNSTLRNCYGGGITLEANANGEVSRSKILYADVATPTPSTGVRVVATANQRTRLTLSGSIVSGWSTGVLSTASGHDGIAYAIVARSTIQGAVTGLLASSTIDASGVIAISGSTVSDNNFGWQINGSNAAIRSRQDNTFEWNGPNTGLLTTVALE